MRFAYIAHPLTCGEGAAVNRIKVDKIVKAFEANHPNIVPLSPLHAFSFMSSEDPEEDERARQRALDLLSLADELRVFGDWQSSRGCLAEIERARELGLPIFYEDGSVEGGDAAARSDFRVPALLKRWTAADGTPPAGIYLRECEIGAAYPFVVIGSNAVQWFPSGNCVLSKIWSFFDALYGPFEAESEIKS